MRAEAVDEVVDLRPPAGNAERGRLDHGEGTHRIGPRRGREERDDAAVGVSGEMGALTEQLSDQACVRLEVDVLDIRALPEPGAVRNDERPSFGERQLRTPGRLAVHHAAVDEHDRRPGSQPRDVKVRGER